MTWMARMTAVLPVTLLLLGSVLHAQTTAPSGALSPAAPSNVQPTTPGSNTGKPASQSPSAPQPSQAPATVGKPGAPQTAAPSYAAPSATTPTTPASNGITSESPSYDSKAGSVPTAPEPAKPNPTSPTTPSTALPAASTVPLSAGGSGTTAGTSAPITLEEAIHRAGTTDHAYISAVADKGTADAARTIARSAVLPSVDYHNQAIYTQPQRPYGAVGTNNAPIFIANNSVREYISQGVVTETVGLGRVVELRKATAEAEAAKVKLEIARRGLVATVVGAYYGVLAADEKARVAAEALAEANRFLTISKQLEAGGEVAHSDVLKAQLQQRQRERDNQDAVLAAEKARLDLGVMLFPDPTVSYTLAADLNHPPALATRAEMEANAKKAAPDVKAALASLRAAQLGVTSSSAAYLPDLSLAYNYGIDSDHFAVHDANGVRNLGYAATATLDIPVWDWFATRAKVKQSQLARDLAKADLTAAQRRALAAFQEYYGEADVAVAQLTSLDRSVEDAREALRLTTLRYSAGDGAVLDVVDAQSTLVSAETARADGVVRYYTALANLQTMTGNLP